MDYIEAYRQVLMDKRVLTATEAGGIWAEFPRWIDEQGESIAALFGLYEHLGRELRGGGRCGVCGEMNSPDCTEGC